MQINWQELARIGKKWQKEHSAAQWKWAWAEGIEGRKEEKSEMWWVMGEGANYSAYELRPGYWNLSAGATPGCCAPSGAPP